MSEENKENPEKDPKDPKEDSNPDESSKPDKPDKPAKPEEDDKDTNQGAEPDETTEIDYQVELEEAKKRLKKSEDAVEREKKRRRELERKGDVDIDETIKSAAREASEATSKKIISEFQRDKRDEYLNSIASSEDEKKLIRFHLKNTITPTGNFREDIENAQALANKKRINHQLSEIKRANNSGLAKGKGSGTPGQKKTDKPAPRLTSDMQKFVKRMGMRWDSEKGLFITRSGKLGVDPETGEQVRLK